MGRVIGLFLLFLGCFSSAQAQRIYGGQIDRRILDSSQPYSYGVGCTFFGDKAAYDALPAQLRFGIYRKKDNQFIQAYFADKSADVSGSNTAISCDKNSKTEYLFIRYNYNLTLNPQTFSDADGYYIVNDPVGPRNPSDNVSSSQIVLYHWFSPAYLWEYFEPAESGKTTPQWVPDSFNYFCANAETNFSLQVVSVPQKTGLGRTNFNLVLTNTAPLTGNIGGSIPYRQADWKTGFSETQMVPGGNFILPPLPPNIFSGQGQTNIVIAAKPVRSGVFTVGFLLQHSRSGVKLSETYREYQIQVEDCLPPPPATIRVSEVNSPAVVASPILCEGKSVQLNAGANQPNVTYQWFKGGIALSNQKDSVLLVKEKGDYTVVLTKKGACLPATSNPLTITVIANPTVTTTSLAPDGLLCKGGTLQLTALPSDKTVKYQWLRDSVLLPNAASVIYEVNQTGNYTVQITDANGCMGLSKTFEVKPNTQTTVAFQPIPVRCSNDTLSVVLVASPVGGVFSGKGVSSKQFNPKLAGAGQHEITYTINQSNACLSGSAKQTAEVRAIPIVNLGPDQELAQNGNLRLNENGNLGPDYIYQWSPTTGLDATSTATPIASPDQTTEYHLKVTDKYGCSNEDAILLGMAKGVHIPDVFTPNGDGFNDIWEIRGLEAFSDNEVFLYNRWGHAIFQSTQAQKATFDGTYNGTPLPAGTYTYIIRTLPAGHTYRGSLLLLR